MDSSNIEFLKIIEISQYAFLYSVIGFPLAYLTNAIFPPLDKTKNMWRLIAEILAQIIIMAIVFYYMKKIVMSVPFIIKNKYYLPYRTGEYLGQAVGAYIMFFYLQSRLQNKLKFLAEVVYNKNYHNIAII